MNKILMSIAGLLCLVGCATSHNCEEPRSLWLNEPTVHVQLRSGAVGGNPVRITMAGSVSNFVDTISSEPLSTATPVSMDEGSCVYAASVGLIPEDKIFRIERIEFVGSCAGDSNGRGQFIIRISEKEIINIEDIPTFFSGYWDGQVDIKPGNERDVFVQISNSSLADVRIEGKFISPD